ncbi:MAG: YHS domain-containing (seleno)protein [Paracoccus sp. (in: a-proteobacteria)]|nr:YHS domain-containing (seleno)protein [Paracoccus sp. (in: a-proteobacteria)]
MLNVLRLALTACFLALPLGAGAQEWALGGYDPVGYVTQNKAMPGRGDISTNWRGKEYHFVSASNRSLFEANPRAYTPGFDGLCVVALSEGRSEPGDPRKFVTIGQRVYLVGSDQRRQRLMEEPRELLMRAKTVWAQLRP